MTVVLFVLTLILYYVKNTYKLNPDNLERSIFLILLCIFAYNILVGNYYIFASAILYFVVQSIKYNFVKNDKIEEFLNNVRKDDLTLEQHFKESFFIFDVLRSFRPVCSFTIVFLGVLSIYTDFTYGFVFISMSTARVFISFYLMVTVLLLAINFMNTPTIMSFFKSCATCTKHVLIGRGFFLECPQHVFLSLHRLSAIMKICLTNFKKAWVFRCRERKRKQTPTGKRNFISCGTINLKIRIPCFLVGELIQRK